MKTGAAPERCAFLAEATLTEATLTQPVAVTRMLPARFGLTLKVTTPVDETFFEVLIPAPRSRTVGFAFEVLLTLTVIVLRCFARTR